MLQLKRETQAAMEKAGNHLMFASWKTKPHFRVAPLTEACWDWKSTRPGLKGIFFFFFLVGVAHPITSVASQIYTRGSCAHKRTDARTHTQSCRTSTAGGSHRRAAAAKFALILPPLHRLHATEFMNVISVRWFAACHLKYGGRDGISVEPRFPSLRRASLIRSRGAITAFAWALPMSRRDAWSL